MSLLQIVTNKIIKQNIKQNNTQTDINFKNICLYETYKVAVSARTISYTFDDSIIPMTLLALEVAPFKCSCDLSSQSSVTPSNFKRIQKNKALRGARTPNLVMTLILNEIDIKSHTLYRLS